MYILLGAASTLITLFLMGYFLFKKTQKVYAPILSILALIIWWFVLNLFAPIWCGVATDCGPSENWHSLFFQGLSLGIDTSYLNSGLEFLLVGCLVWLAILLARFGWTLLKR